ncbi:MAG: hypothetical protein AB9907_01150 [Flexilinea sp.]
MFVRFELHSSAETALVEREWLGGTCLNVGCIPTKSLFEEC